MNYRIQCGYHLPMAGIRHIYIIIHVMLTTENLVNKCESYTSGLKYSKKRREKFYQTIWLPGFINIH